jgi:ribonucleoside-diphosphate reductase beta chain
MTSFTLFDNEPTIEEITLQRRDKVMNGIHNGSIPHEKIAYIPMEYLDVTSIPGVASENILTESRVYKPFRYEFGYRMYEMQNNLHWMQDKISMDEDIVQFGRLPDQQREVLEDIFPMFVKNDMVAEDFWAGKYQRIFKPHEIQMGIGAAVNMEAIHKSAYAYLLDSLAFPVGRYSDFLTHQEATDKLDYTTGFHMTSLYETLASIFMFGAMTEGVQLYGNFAVMMSFPHRNLMKGMGQVVTWSVRDESLHCGFAAQLWKHTLLEFGHLIDIKALFTWCQKIAHRVYQNEVGFATLIFRRGPLPDMTFEQHCQYMRHLIDSRLKSYGIAPIFGEPETPYDFLTSLLSGVEYANFFEQRATEYGMANLTGSFQPAYGAALSEIDFIKEKRKSLGFAVPEGV